MNDKNISHNTLNPHGFHYVRRSMALKMISCFSDMPAEIRKHLGGNITKKYLEKYIYARPSKKQMEAAIATLLDLEVPIK